MERIYLDYAALAPALPEVRAAMEPWLDKPWNPNSVHAEGRKARAALEIARATLARSFGVAARDLLFTASGSESISLAILGYAGRHASGRILTTAVEHAAVLACATELRARGWQHEYIPIDARGVPKLTELRKLLETPHGGATIVSCMLVNNELGSVSDLQAIAEITKLHGAYLHCDAIAGGESVALEPAFAADAVSLAAQKYGGPVGAGVLYIRERQNIGALVFGGTQEFGLRAGTENLAAIIGAVEAFRLRNARLAARKIQLAKQQVEFEAALAAEIAPEMLYRVSTEGDRSAGLTHFILRDLDSATLLAALDLAGLAVSAGSACAAGAVKRSHVVEALNLDARLSGVVRCSWGSAIETATLLDAAKRIGHVARQLYEVQALAR